ncbi:MAG: hypothetical protein A3J58_00550 [Candidatus Sungbacteria bacterium RIFCSPHIGHO2_02_FULL_52_23]|uniref:Transcriptional repressor PaaX-like central Cas2-like domain-containing protein n=1 Tax=Candidatus Sungbacteria bacterium RIFCSPHIGHO2_02_FULL_52_23 TaxID=1802274 RepID=A0A1G2KV21_9BACT|nr:MAG: hypothetical protein A3J58_00550 [Candidatus Sungbacteria bacterium RIFCSPHIGHO2_02_FULL_52_23]
MRFISPYTFLMRHHSIARTILEHLAQMGPLVIDLLIPPHPRSRIARALIGMDQKQRYPSRSSAAHSYSSILNRLKREGLVLRSGSKRSSLWKISSKGRLVLGEQQKATPRPIQHLTYDVLPPEDEAVRLITFDIPEKQRTKRDWLRTELLACGYKLLQKSVFIGRRPLPEEFLKMIEALSLGPYIHFVGIDKKGTLIKNA